MPEPAGFERVDPALSGSIRFDRGAIPRNPPRKRPLEQPGIPVPETIRGRWNTKCPRGPRTPSHSGLDRGGAFRALPQASHRRVVCPGAWGFQSPSVGCVIASRASSKAACPNSGLPSCRFPAQRAGSPARPVLACDFVVTHWQSRHRAELNKNSCSKCEASSTASM